MAYADLITVEEVKTLLSEILAEKGQDYRDDFVETLFRMIEELPHENEVRRQMLKVFRDIKPDRCGIIDLDANEVKYNEEKYTQWHSNYPLCQIHDLLYIFDFVGLDYELRLPRHVTPGNSFTIFTIDSEEEKKKYSIASEIHSAFILKYMHILEEAGLKPRIYGSAYRGCEKELYPERFGGQEAGLVSFDEFKAIIKDLYEPAYYAVVQRVFELKLEDSIDEKGRARKYCIAKLDEKKLEECRKDGFSISKINIPAEKFNEHILSEDTINGLKVYTLGFYMD